MPDAIAFMPPDGQSEYAFPADQGQDEADISAQRNQQIQQSFDQQRLQRAFIQNFAKAISGQSAQIAKLRQRQNAVQGQ